MKKSLVAVGIGLRVKSGRAIGIALRGPVESPTVLERKELILSDPGKPTTWQPYHGVIDLSWEEAEAAVRETTAAIASVAARAIEDWARELRASGLELCGVGVVAGSGRDPAKIPNPHIRAHAAEGRLFRQAFERGAEACGLFRRSFVESGVYERGASELRCAEATLRDQITALGGKVVRPWRADEKVAALVAWLILAR